jgi:hypothetical protein
VLPDAIEPTAASWDADAPVAKLLGDAQNCDAARRMSDASPQQPVEREVAVLRDTTDAPVLL